MTLISKKTVPVFDTEKIKIGDLVHVKMDGWKSARNGIVIGVSEENIAVQFSLGKGGSTSHLKFTAEELSTGTYEFRWSSDLLEIHSLEEGGESDAT